MSPAVSKSQFREMFVLKKEGKITEKQLKDFTTGVDYKKLPEKKKPEKAKKG